MIRIKEISQQWVERLPQLFAGTKAVQPAKHFQGRAAFHFLVKLRFSQETPQQCDELEYTNEGDQVRMIKIEKVQDGYLARATPPHVPEFWRNPTPLGRSELVEELKALGVHTTDITDAFYEADPNWLQQP